MPRKTAISRQRLAALTALAGATGVISALAASGIGSASGPGTWTTLAPSGPNRQEVAFTQTGGKMYLFGGTSTEQQEVYDPATNAWSSPATNVPQPEGKLDHVQSVVVGGKIYYVGGLTGWPGPAVGTVHVYDPASGWSTGSAMDAGRERGAGGVAVHDGKIYYAGGIRNNAAVALFDVYDPATNQWTALENMPTARDHFHAAVLDGRFWAIGGRKGPSAVQSPIRDNEAYNFSTGQWQKGLAPLPTARGGFAAAAVNCEIFVIGGEGNGPVNGAYDAVEAYHPATNSWRTLTDMPTARHGIQAAVLGGRIYIAAGGKQQYGGAATDVLERFDPGAQSKCGSTPPGSVGGGGSGGPSGSIGDRTAPSIRQVTLSRRAFRTVRGRGLYGTRVKLSLSEKATLYMSVRKLRRTRPAKRIAGVVKRSVGAGRISVLFRGRVDGRRLRPGRYRLVMVAVDAASNVSGVARVRFSVLR